MRQKYTRDLQNYYFLIPLNGKAGSCPTYPLNKGGNGVLKGNKFIPSPKQIQIPVTHPGTVLTRRRVCYSLSMLVRIVDFFLVSHKVEFD